MVLPTIQIIQFNPVELISIIEIFVAALFSFILTIKVSFKYKENKERSILLFVLIFIFLGTALVFLGSNRIVLFTSNNQFTRFLFNNMAIIFSFVVVALFDMFSFEMTYPDEVKKLTFIVILDLIFLSIWFLINQPSPVINGDLVYPDYVFLIAMPFLLPLIAIPILVFLIYSNRNINKARPGALRIATMGIAQIIITISFIFELLGFFDIISLFVRLGFLIYAIIMYISITMPDWYKNAIGWE